MENLELLFIIIFLLCIILSMVISIIKFYSIKEDKSILTSKTIFVHSRLLQNIFLWFFLIVFLLIMGLLLIYLGITIKMEIANKIASLSIGSILIFLSLKIIIKIFVKCKRILNGDYVIVEDILSEKDVHYNSNDNEVCLLYFENYFRKYNKEIIVDKIIFSKCKKGDKFYLVFTKNNVYAFNSCDYELESREKVISIDSLSNYIKLTEFKIDKNIENIRINKKRLIDDFFDKSQKKTIFISLAILIFLILPLALVLFVYYDILAFIIVLVVFIFWSFLSVVKIKYVIDIIRNIKNDNYKVKVDTLISINDRVSFKDSNDIMSFKFKNYKKIIYEDKKKYSDANIGDEFYLVFVKGERNPIKIYNTKSTIMENDINIDRNNV